MLAGIAADGTAYSQWLLMFCLFLFFSLATVKRCAELIANREAGKMKVTGRGYNVEDLIVLFPLTAAAGFGAVLIVALYLSSPDVSALYGHPKRIYLVCPLLIYWICRVMMLTNRNQMHDDPVVFALTDRVSLLTAVGAFLIILASI